MTSAYSIARFESTKISVETSRHTTALPLKRPPVSNLGFIYTENVSGWEPKLFTRLLIVDYFINKIDSYKPTLHPRGNVRNINLFKNMSDLIVYLLSIRFRFISFQTRIL